MIGDTGGVNWRGLDIAGLTGRIEIAGGPSDSGVTSDLMGHPLNALAWLVNKDRKVLEPSLADGRPAVEAHCPGAA